MLCLDRNKGGCDGPVEMHTLDPGVRPAFPRCAYHWNKRLTANERHRATYPDSPIAPAWFDPADAGERWDDDY